MKMNNHIISWALPNIKGTTVCGGYLFASETETSRRTIVLFFDLLSCCLIKMKFERLILKTSQHQYLMYDNIPNSMLYLTFHQP